MRKWLCLCSIGAISALAWVARTSAGNALPAGPQDDGTKAGLVRIAGEGLLNSHAYQYLEELSDQVGSRVTGTPQAQKSIDWGVAKMQAIGLQNVHTEKWQMWRGWTRGPATGELIFPAHQVLHMDAMGWTGSTPSGGAEGEVIPVNMFDLDQEMKASSRWKGKVLMTVHHGTAKKSGEEMFGEFGNFLRGAKKAGAIAVISGQGGRVAAGMNLTHTGILGFAVDFEIPVVSLTMEDQGQLERDLDKGITPRVRLNVQNTFTNGPVQSANVVGEIRGSEHPEQIFVVGAHLDSWDLAQGSTDNGIGVTCVLGAAEAIVRSGQHPRRTLRFVLFTGEEQGLLGSFAYVADHKSELGNHLGDLVLDNGQGPVKAFNLGGRDDLMAAFQPFADSLQSIRTIEVDDKIEQGTDTLPFTIVGLPGINMDQDSPDYKYTHHSSADSFDAIKEDVLTQDATLMALTAFWVADRPERLAEPWPADRTARMLRQKHVDGMLKIIKQWPYGD